ncbi:MAG: ABC transporter substrate-binding protein [Lautropia sp.]
MKALPRLFLAAVICLSAAIAAPPVRAQELTIALPSALITLDPVHATVSSDISMLSSLYSPLVSVGPDMQLRGVLAESWQQPDALTWQFKLRPDVTFPNGEKLDAAAVKWNLERLRNPAVKARAGGWYTAVSEVRADSPTELVIKTSSPWPGLLQQFSTLYFTAPQWTQKQNLSTEAMGTGPYDIESYVPGDRVVLKAKKDYRLGDRPAFDRVVVRIVPDAASRVAGLLTGELDVITEFAPSEIARIRKAGRFEVGAVESARSYLARINTEKPPFRDNVALRQAANLAIDKQALIDGLFEGQGTVANCQLLSRFYFGYNPALKPYPYDPARARALIKSSGAATPVAIDIEVPTGRYPMAEDMAQAMAQQLNDVGFQTTVKQMSFTAYMQKYGAQHDMGPVALATYAWISLDTDGQLKVFTPAFSASYWHDKEFVKLLDEARRATDDTARERIYHQATARMCEQAPIIFLFNQKTTYATSRRVDWQARADDWVRPAEMKPRK